MTTALTPEPRRATILLVEDDDDTRDLLTRALERAGHNCVAAACAASALERAGDGERIDLVVCDVVLGPDDRAGLALIESLRHRGLDAPVVVMTAFADVEKLKIALNQGAAHFLEKPFRAPELVAVVARLLARERDAAPSLTRFFAQSRLTDKEQRVARYLLEGLSSREIADREHNSPKTIRQHVSEIYSKCGVTSRAQFFRFVFLGREPRSRP